MLKSLNTSIGPVLELYGATADSYLKMNLGISKLQAQEVANLDLMLLFDLQITEM